MIFESYVRNVCNFRKKVMANDYKQLGFCSLMRAHLSAELLNLRVWELLPLRTWAQVISCGPAGDEPLAKLWSPHGCDQALMPRAWLIAARLDQEMPGPDASSSGLLSSAKSICLHDCALKYDVKWIRLKTALTPSFWERVFFKNG